MGASGKRATGLIPLFRDLESRNDLEIHSVCTNGTREAAKKTGQRFGAPNRYVEFDQLLQDTLLDAVYLATPMPLHASQAIAALEQDIHVLSEVPAGVSIAECRKLVRATQDSSAHYMLGENTNFFESNMIIREVVDDGCFGEIHHAEGEYSHDTRDLLTNTDWRREWQFGRNGIVYPTHQLGPILSWLREDRIDRVSCTGSGRQFEDSDGDLFELEAHTMMVARTDNDRQVVIRLDKQTPRPHEPTVKYQLQGTKGWYESSRAEHEFDKLHLVNQCESDEWLDVTELKEYMPPFWQDPPTGLPEIHDAAHGGGDYLMLLRFAEAVKNDECSPIDIHAAMDMTLPGLVSQQSIANDGEWLVVPDSREW